MNVVFVPGHGYGSGRFPLEPPAGGPAIAPLTSPHANMPIEPRVPDLPLTVHPQPQRPDYIPKVYWQHYLSAGQQHGVPPLLLARQGQHESKNFDTRVVAGNLDSPKGAQGIAQFRPRTAAAWGVDTSDFVSSIDGQARYMRHLYDRFGSWKAAAAAYNAGPTKFAKWKRKYGSAWIDNIPAAETREYVPTIFGDRTFEVTGPANLLFEPTSGPSPMINPVKIDQRVETVNSPMPGAPLPGSFVENPPPPRQPHGLPMPVPDRNPTRVPPPPPPPPDRNPDRASLAPRRPVRFAAARKPRAQVPFVPTELAQILDPQHAPAQDNPAQEPFVHRSLKQILGA